MMPLCIAGLVLHCTKFQTNSPISKTTVPLNTKFNMTIIIINTEIAMINQRLLVNLSAKIPPSDVPITPATPLINNAIETKDNS